MQLLGRLQIQSRERIIKFLNQQHVGRIATIDKNGYPQIIPMNFVYHDNAIYMHSHVRGEKLDNIKSEPKSGFEVDCELEFLPSYFFSPTDASLADTLYISVVIKGETYVVQNVDEKVAALNALMQKYQPEGSYEPMNPSMDVLSHVSVMKTMPHQMRGKYKIGQNMKQEARMNLAQKIFERNTPSARETLRIMGFEVTQDGLRMVDQPVW